ncbi:MAG: SAM-dependent chlorinase/fluorinase [Candidatus Omnitrophica bacterium]|nr:SAM-dependent chlorinase/fluorinase [Candidatus Omnitrophota bacterium]
MNTISLITDFGYKDNFVGVMKAVILKINPKVTIVDLCHEIEPQDVLGASFLLRGSFGYFPLGTVHLVVVDPGVGSKRKRLLVQTKDYFFIGPDNGVFWFALKDETILKIIEITNERYFLKPVSDTFEGRDIFAPVAAYVSKGECVEKFGKITDSLMPLEFPELKKNNRYLIGEIIHIDNFGNLISNIDKNTFDNFTKDRRFKIVIEGVVINKISQGYFEGSSLRPLALFDSFGYLEVAIKNGSAQKLLKVEKGAKLKVIKT